MAPIVTSSRKSRPSGRGGKGADAFLTPVLVAVIVLAALAILRPVILPSGKTAPAPEAGDETTARPSSRTVASPRSGGGNGEDPSDTAAPGGEGNGATRRQPRAATRNAAERTAEGSADAADDTAGDADEPSDEADTKPVETAGIQPPQYFDNEVENKIAIFCMPATESFGPQVRTTLSDEEIIAYLKRPITILDDDEPKIVEIKERTAKLKGEALAFMEAGGTFDQFMRDVAAKGNFEAGQIEDVRVEMRKILETKGRKAAEEYLSQANPYLEEQGLPKVTISPLDLLDLDND